MIATLTPTSIPLGASVPALTPHAISVSLPTWADNVAYEEGHPRVVDKMETGYPRFFIHRSIQKLAQLCLNKFGSPGEKCILLPSARVAAEARDFMASQNPSLPSRIVEFVICPSTTLDRAGTSKVEVIELQILLFDESHWSTAKAFWQHTGDGISSRLAERALLFLGETPAGAPELNGSHRSSISSSSDRGRGYSRNLHYARKSSTPSTPTSPLSSTTPSFTPATADHDDPVTGETLTSDLTTYLEERYGRNLPLFNANLAKQALKRRIVGGLLPSDEGFGQLANVTRGVGEGIVTEDDVWLFPCGMSAIWHAHDICRIARRRSGKPEGKSICYG